MVAHLDGDGTLTWKTDAHLGDAHNQQGVYGTHAGGIWWVGGKGGLHPCSKVRRPAEGGGLIFTEIINYSISSVIRGSHRWGSGGGGS